MWEIRDLDRLLILQLLRGHQHLGVVAEGNQREEIARRQLVHQAHRRLAGLLDLRAGHRAGAVQHDRQVERRSFELLVVAGGSEVNLDHNFLRRT